LFFLQKNFEGDLQSMIGILFAVVFFPVSGYGGTMAMGAFECYGY
jgi:hypothetical protein